MASFSAHLAHFCIIISLLLKMDAHGTDDRVFRPRKSRRLLRDATATGAASVSFHPEHPLLFDTIPKEVFDNVLKFTSRLPMAATWEKHIRLHDIQEFYGVHGGWGSFMNGRFHTLCISKTMDCDDEHVFYKWKKRSGAMLWTDDINEAHQFILKAGGVSLHTIIVGEDTFDEAVNGTEMVDHFVAKCPNVKSLSVVENFGLWVSKFGKQLERLEVASGGPILAIRVPCLSLLELTFSSRKERTGLNFPECDIDEIDWEHVGDSLQSLTISHFLTSKSGLKKIKKHCKKLNTFL